MSPTLILTRPKEQAERFYADLCAALDRAPKVLYSPVLRIEGVTQIVSKEHYDIVLATSANGIVFSGSIDRPMPALCVGQATAQAAKQRGYQSRAMGGTAKALAFAVTNRAEFRDKRFLYLRGEEVRFDLAGHLRQAGLLVDERITYRQVGQDLGKDAMMALASEPTVLPLFSANSAAAVKTSIYGANIADCVLPCISADVAQEFCDHKIPSGCKTVVAFEPTTEAMIAQIAKLV